MNTSTSLEQRKSSKKLDRRPSVSAKRYETPKDRKEKKEEDKNIALLHPSTKQRVEALFEQNGNQDVTVEELIEYLDSLQEIQDFEGINYNTGLVHKFMEDQPYNMLPRRGALVVVGRFVSDARKHSDRIRREDRVDVASGKVKLLSTGAYIRQWLTCALSDKKYTYKWRGLSTVDPKTSLVLIVVVITAIMSLALVAFLTLINVSLVLDTAARSIADDSAAFAGLLDEVFPAVSSEFVEGFGNVARDLSGAASAAVVGAGAATLDASRLGDENFVKLVEAAQRRVVDAEAQRLAGHLETARLRRAVLDESPIDMRTKLVAEVDAECSVVVAALAPLDVSFSSPRCATCPTPLAMRCVAGLPSLAVGAAAVGEEPDLRSGRHGLTVAMRVTASLGICLSRPLDLLRNETIDAMRRLAAAFVGNGSDRAVHLRVSGAPAGATQQLSPRAAAPAAALAILRSATNFTSGELINASAGLQWSYAATVLPQTGLFVLATTLSSHADVATRAAEELHEALAAPTSGATTAAATLPSVRIEMLMRGAGGELVARRKSPLASTTRESRHAPHVVLGLSGQSGAIFSRDGSLENVIGGFASVAFHGLSMTIALERPTASIRDGVVAFVRALLSATRGLSLQDGRRIDVFYRRADGAVANLVPGAPAAEPDSFPHRCLEERLASAVERADGEQQHCRYVASAQVAVVASLDRNHVERRIWINVGIAVAVGAVLSVLSLILIRQLTKNVLDHIEKDYVSYKQQIEEEKRQFSELVKDVMPSYISKRIMAGEKLIVDLHPQLTFLFSDIVGFTEESRKMSTTEMVRLLGYMFMVEDGVAEHYNIHKIKTIGDAYFAVSGLEDAARNRKRKEKKTVQDDQQSEDPRGGGGGGAGGGSGPNGDGGFGGDVIDVESEDDESENAKTNNQVYRMVSFACALHLINSKEFVHNPERTECFKQLAGDSDPGPFRVLSMRMGIHSGPAIAGVVDVGRAPHFDCFGPSVNLASRMESTAPIDRIQISAPTFEILQALDVKDVFEFDAPRKTLVKGYGTIKTYTLKATSLGVSDDLLRKLHVERAVTRKIFGEHGLGTDGAGTNSRSNTESVARSTDRGSSIAEQDAIREFSFTDQQTPTAQAKGASTKAGTSPTTAPPSANLPPPPSFSAPREQYPTSAFGSAPLERSQPVPLPPPPALPSMFGALPQIPHPL